MTKDKKPKYLHPLHFLKDGYMMIPLGVQELVNASNILITNKLYAQALSLSVIALEECGKLFILDSLLFKSNKKNDHYKKRSISHKDKLDAMRYCIALFLHVSRCDERFLDDGTKEIFSKEINTRLSKLDEEIRNLRDKLQNEDLHQLDLLKQKGFYSSDFNQKFVIPSSVIDKELCLFTNKLANSFSENMNLIFNKLAVEKYISQAETIRNKMSINDWNELRSYINPEVTNLQ